MTVKIEEQPVERIENFPTWNEGTDLSQLLAGKAGTFLREYRESSRRDPKVLEKDVKAIAKKGFEIGKYPCFQKFWFLRCELAQASIYPDVLATIRAGGLFADLGCAVGQDIRRLVFDGAPSENLIGMDYEGSLVELGYELFQDRATLRSKFIVQNFLADSPETDSIRGKLSIVNCGYFLHGGWDWDDQVKVVKRMIDLLRPEQGSMATGIQFGSQAPGMWNSPVGVPLYLHNDNTLSKLWSQAGSETGTAWEVRCDVEEDADCNDLDPQGCQLRWVAVRR